MEVELRAIEADNERILQEVQAAEAAEARLKAVQEAQDVARARMDEEVRVTVQARQRVAAERRTLEAASARRAAQAELVEALRAQEALELQMAASQRQTLQGVQDTVAVLQLQRRLRRSLWLGRGLLLALLLSWSAIGGMVALVLADPAWLTYFGSLISTLH
jgi:hypothetical protein